MSEPLEPKTLEVLDVEGLEFLARSALADKPHAQPWEQRTADGYPSLVKHANPWNKHVATCSEDIYAEFIATFDPPTVLRLLSRVREAEEAWMWLAGRTNLELSWGDHPDAAEGDECVWMVNRRVGSVNDCEWELFGSGETPLEAVLDARSVLEPSK